MSLGQFLLTLKGGAGSGNFGHAGIPGYRGGSAPSKWSQKSKIVVDPYTKEELTLETFSNPNFEKPDEEHVTLYHSTSAKHLPSIIKEGLIVGGAYRDLPLEQVPRGGGSAVWGTKSNQVKDLVEFRQDDAGAVVKYVVPKSQVYKDEQGWQSDDIPSKYIKEVSFIAQDAMDIVEKLT